MLVLTNMQNHSLFVTEAPKSPHNLSQGSIQQGPEPTLLPLISTEINVS